jgi:hypothetical protein
MNVHPRSINVINIIINPYELNINDFKEKQNADRQSILP